MVETLLPEWFEAGGGVMWIILLAGVVALFVLFEKLWTLRTKAVLQPELAQQVQALVRGGRLDEAVAHCRSHPGPHASMAAAALEQAGAGREEMRHAAEAAGRQELARLERYLPLMRTVAAVAPLLGLFGTVLGMIDVFGSISGGGLGQGDALAGGIQKALLTTAFGLGVAIPSLVLHEALSDRIDRLALQVEREVLSLIEAAARQGGATPPAVSAPEPAPPSGLTAEASSGGLA
ncbi:MAG: MotA/TolQ/ExbB proton channel family protein [Acidobacteriota bacterium]